MREIFCGSACGHNKGGTAVGKEDGQDEKDHRGDAARVRDFFHGNCGRADT